MVDIVPGKDGNKNIKFHSKIRKEYYVQLENIFFFNENQSRYYDKIIKIVEKYGEPYISKNGEFLTIELERIKTKCLFASIGPKLVGVFIYKKNLMSKGISVIHIAIDEKYNNIEKSNKKGIVSSMLDELCKIYDDIIFFDILYLNKKIAV